MFEISALVVLDEEEPTGAYPRRALIVVDPPKPVTVEVAQWLSDGKPRWAERPLWLRAAGVKNHPVTGVLHAWIRLASNDWFGLVSVELTSHREQIRLVLPYQLVPVKALRPDPSAAGE